MTTVLDLVEPWSVYLFGEPGCGKTTLTALAPKPLFIMVDRNGHRALRRLALPIPMIRTRTWNEFEDAVKKIHQHEFFDDCLTIVVDTFSRAQQLSNKQQYVNLPKGRKDLSENEYKITNSRMEDMMTRLQDTGKNTIFVAHEREDKDNEGTTILIRPANSEGTMGNVLAQTDGVFYMSSLNGRRKIRTVASGKIKAKSRFTESLPDQVENPDAKFWQLLEVS